MDGRSVAARRAATVTAARVEGGVKIKSKCSPSMHAWACPFEAHSCSPGTEPARTLSSPRYVLVRELVSAARKAVLWPSLVLPIRAPVYVRGASALIGMRTGGNSDGRFTPLVSFSFFDSVSSIMTKYKRRQVENERCFCRRRQANGQLRARIAASMRACCCLGHKRTKRRLKR